MIIYGFMKKQHLMVLRMLKRVKYLYLVVYGDYF